MYLGRKVTVSSESFFPFRSSWFKIALLETPCNQWKQLTGQSQSQHTIQKTHRLGFDPCKHHQKLSGSPAITNRFPPLPLRFSEKDGYTANTDTIRISQPPPQPQLTIPRNSCKASSASKVNAKTWRFLVMKDGECKVITSAEKLKFLFQSI